MSKKFNKIQRTNNQPSTQESTMAEEVKPVEETVEEVVTETTAAVPVATEAVTDAADAVVESTETTEKVVESTDLGVKDASVVESMPAVNISANMLQESDPVEDGSLVKAMEQAPVTIVAAQAAAPVIKEAGTEEKSEEEVYLDKVRISGTDVQKRILAAVETFASKMKPRVEIEPSKGAAIQVEFLDHLLWLLKKDYESFRGGWNVLLVYFGLYHGVNNVRNYTALSEFSTTRFLFAWTKGIDKCNCYRNLITLLRATRNKDTRKHDIKTINLAFVGPNVLGEDELNNLKQFYQV